MATKEKKVLKSIYFSQEMLTSLNERCRAEKTQLANLVRRFCAEGLARPATGTGVRAAIEPKEPLVLQIHKVPAALDLRLVNRANRTPGQSASDLAREYIGCGLKGPPPTEKELEYARTAQPLLLRNIYLEATTLEALRALASAMQETTGVLVRAYLARGMGV